MFCNLNNSPHIDRCQLNYQWSSYLTVYIIGTKANENMKVIVMEERGIFPSDTFPSDISKTF